MYHNTAYDDTSLTIDNKDILLPYNRFIQPAGTIIKFGDPALENHSLDCALLPGEKILVVEDRYGIAFADVSTNQLLFHLMYGKENAYAGLMSTYSGIKIAEHEGKVHIYWGAASPLSKKSFVMDAVWDGKKAVFNDAILFNALSPAPMSLPNDIAIRKEGNEQFLYVVLNGNSQLIKMRLSDKKIIWTSSTGMAPYGLTLTASKAYVTNWAGPVPTDNGMETAGIPYANVYIDPRTGATSKGTVTVIDLHTGTKISEIEVGLHPNAIISNKEEHFLYVSNGNSDNVSVI
ncbi:MAG TPA: phosphoesterase, partial [Flavisolibacter sp.]|nr:phosphoesterase [Flavisolibacter sp.]